MSQVEETNEVRCNLVVIRSQQMDRSAAFYEALGPRFQKHRQGGGPEHYASESESQTFEIYPLAKDTTPTTETRIGFAVVEVDSIDCE